MNLDKVFVRRVLEGGLQAFTHIKKCGIVSEMVYGEGKAVFDWAEKYLKEHGAVPSPELAEANLGIALEISDAALPFLEDEILKRQLFNVLADGFKSIGQSMDSRDPRKAYSEMLSLSEKARCVGLSDSRVVSLLGLGEEVIAKYERAKKGETGILTPWPSVNDMTGGLWPEEMTGVVGRPSVGKSFLLTLMVRHAWALGHRPLVVTTEMSQLKMAFRFYACHLRLPYRAFSKGKLGNLVEPKMYEGIRTVLNDPNLAIVGGDFDMTIEGVEDAVREFKPDVVFIDGLYLLRPRERRGKDDRHSRVSEVLEDTKRQSRRHGLPYVFTMQFNREMKKGDKESADLSNIGMTDVAGQVSDNLFGMVQSDDMKTDKKLLMKNLKLREGEGKDVWLRWDFDAMDFSEEGRSADEFVDDVNFSTLKEPSPIPVQDLGEKPDSQKEVTF